MTTLAQRARSAEKNFGDYCTFVGDLVLSPHQDDWIEACQDIGDNPTGGQKYIIVAPPGFGKSEIIAKLFTTWMIGKYPENHGALLSYGNKPAYARSSAMRQVIKSDPAYHVVFPDTRPDPSKFGAGEFNVVRKKASPHPTMLCGGTRSAVVSYRINWLVMDDAIDQKQAANIDQLMKAWENYQNAIFTRLTRGAPQMNIGTRWSDDDFIAELMKEGDWNLIHVPALDHRGKSVWPTGKTTKELLKIKHDKPELFQVQYMGDPSAKGIGIIKKMGTFQHVPDQDLVKEKDLLVAAAWDTAYKDKQQNDFTVGYVGGLDKYRRVWVLDRRKDRYTTPDVIKEIKDVQEVWDPYYQWVEDTSGGTPAVQMIQQEVEELLPLETVPPSQGGKRSRAHALAPYMHSGRVIMPRFAEWYEDAHYYLTRFPFISHDDDIDALWLLVSKLIVLTHPSEYGRRGEYSMIIE